MPAKPALALTHSGVSLYLYLASFVFAAFVAKRPSRACAADPQCLHVGRHRRRRLPASSAISIWCPARTSCMTRYGRATGLFKDPNVFGPFLIPALVYALQPARRHVAAQVACCRSSCSASSALRSCSASRAAPGSTWAWPSAIFGALHFLTARDNRLRLRPARLAIDARSRPPSCVFVAPCSPTRSPSLLSERAALTQSYDEGPEGRFGGQEKAVAADRSKSLRASARSNSCRSYHHEEPHNVYLAMFLNAGWLGGLMFLGLIGTTRCWGLRHAFVRGADAAAVPGGLRLLRRPCLRGPHHRPRPLAPLLPAAGAGVGIDGGQRRARLLRRAPARHDSADYARVVLLASRRAARPADQGDRRP